MNAEVAFVYLNGLAWLLTAAALWVASRGFRAEHRRYRFVLALGGLAATAAGILTLLGGLAGPQAAEAVGQLAAGAAMLYCTGVLQRRK